MILDEQVYPHSIKRGFESVMIEAGKALKVETSPNGEEILEVVCPPGKKWLARLEVTIKETDA